MAEKRETIKVIIPDGLWIDVWCDPEMVDKIMTIEGVTKVEPPDHSNRRTVWTDSRYSMGEIASEIEALAVVQ